jgi:hypothetical protein
MLLPLIVILLFCFGCLSGAITEYQEGNHSAGTVGAIMIFGGVFFGSLAYITTL